MRRHAVKPRAPAPYDAGGFFLALGYALILGAASWILLIALVDSLI